MTFMVGYVIDIREVDTDNCPQGFQELIQYPWPGTYDGCYCQAIVNNHASEYILQVWGILCRGRVPVN